MALNEIEVDWTSASTGMITPEDLLNVPESTWLTGAIAYLFSPFPVNAGQWQSDQMVNKFIKNLDGRWYSDPGADVGYPDLMALSLAAPIRSVDNPERVKVIQVEIVTPPEDIPSAPIDLEMIALMGEGSQFATEIGVEVEVREDARFATEKVEVTAENIGVTANDTVAMHEPTEITSKPKGVPWWVWAGGAALGIYVLTRK